MIVIHAVKTVPRLVETALSERLRVMATVVVTGARQTGKRTLTATESPAGDSASPCR